MAAMLNYAIDPRFLAALVPPGTELDQFEGRTYASLIGFRFLRTRVLGFWIPFHSDFDEVNLRFYVRRMVAGEVRRDLAECLTHPPDSAFMAEGSSVAVLPRAYSGQ